MKAIVTGGRIGMNREPPHENLEALAPGLAEEINRTIAVVDEALSRSFRPKMPSRRRPMSLIGLVLMVIGVPYATQYSLHEEPNHMNDHWAENNQNSQKLRLMNQLYLSHNHWAPWYYAPHLNGTDLITEDADRHVGKVKAAFHVQWLWVKDERTGAMCSINHLGVVHVLAVEGNTVRLTYRSPRGISGAMCPDQAIFFMDIDELNQWPRLTWRKMNR